MCTVFDGPFPKPNCAVLASNTTTALEQIGYEEDNRINLLHLEKAINFFLEAKQLDDPFKVFNKTIKWCSYIACKDAILGLDLVPLPSGSIRDTAKWTDDHVHPIIADYANKLLTIYQKVFDLKVADINPSDLNDLLMFFDKLTENETLRISKLNLQKTTQF